MASSNVHTFNDSNFDAEVTSSEGLVLIDFTATWCGPCKLLAPIVEKLADDYAGRVKVGKISIEDSPALATKCGVRSVPAVVVFENGKVKVSHHGFAKRDRLLELLGLS